MRRKVNIVTLVVLVIYLLGWYFYSVPLYYLIPIVLIYLTINIVGSVVIRLGYFIQSYCNSITEKKEIAFTFDDGPDPEITPKLIELLGKHNIKATFFCTGINLESNPEIALKLIDSGHIIGNHSYGHSKFFDLFSSSKMQKEINITNNIIQSFSKKAPLLFRPPYGVTNPMLMKAINATNMISVGWSLRSFDTVKDASQVLKKLKSRTRPGDIVLFHDTNENIITIIEDYINWLSTNGYLVVNLDELLNIPAYEN